jgi:hypothetical protein
VVEVEAWTGEGGFGDDMGWCWFDAWNLRGLYLQHHAPGPLLRPEGGEKEDPLKLCIVGLIPTFLIFLIKCYIGTSFPGVRHAC